MHERLQLTTARLQSRTFLACYAAGTLALRNTDAQDVNLVFSNCWTYNGGVGEVGEFGVKLNQVWLQLWATSGLAGTPSDSMVCAAALVVAACCSSHECIVCTSVTH